MEKKEGVGSNYRNAAMLAPKGTHYRKRDERWSRSIPKYLKAWEGSSLMMHNAIRYLRMSNTGLALLVIAAVGDLIIPFILAPFCNKYNHLTMVMSSLGNRNCPLHFIYNLWLIIAGILFVIGSVKLHTILFIRSNSLSLGIVSLIFFILALTFFVLFIMADKERFAKTIISNEGLWQRLSLLCMYAPILMASYKNLLGN